MAMERPQRLKRYGRELNLNTFQDGDYLHEAPGSTNGFHDSCNSHNFCWMKDVTRTKYP